STHWSKQILPLSSHVATLDLLSFPTRRSSDLPVVVTAPPLSAVAPGASVVRLVSGAVPPTTPLNNVVPAVLTVRPNAPSTVLIRSEEHTPDLQTRRELVCRLLPPKICVPVVVT